MGTRVLFLSRDLFFWPTVQAAAQELGGDAIMSRWPLSQAVQAEGAGRIGCCLIDLSAMEAAQLAAITAELSQSLGVQRFIAFGPHVQQARLAAAEAAGCWPVLTRGQLQAKLADYLRPCLNQNPCFNRSED